MDDDIRRTWTYSARSSALHLFTRLCPDPTVADWGHSSPVEFSFKPGVMIKETRRPAYTQTMGTHHVGVLNFETKRATKPRVEVAQTLYIPGSWCVVDSLEINNLTDEEDKEAAVAVALNLRRQVDTNRAGLDWNADFHSAGKSGGPSISRFSDEEYQRLLPFWMSLCMILTSCARRFFMTLTRRLRDSGSA